MMNPSITIVIDMTTGRRRVQKNPPEDPPPPQDTSERLQCIVCFKDLNNSRVILICVIFAPKLVNLWRKELCMRCTWRVKRRVTYRQIFDTIKNDSDFCHKKKYVLKPCGNGLLCGGCSRRVAENPNCILCNQAITGRMEIFIS